MLIFWFFELLCGRANAMINNAKAHISSAKSMCCAYTFQLFGISEKKLVSVNFT